MLRRHAHAPGISFRERFRGEVARTGQVALVRRSKRMVTIGEGTRPFVYFLINDWYFFFSPCLGSAKKPIAQKKRAPRMPTSMPCLE